MSPERPKLSATLATREILCQTYLDWRNNYLTVSVFAEHYGITEDQASVLIGLCRQVYQSPHPES